jgi:membrane protein implicated in regulation of membrane protease activity
VAAWLWFIVGVALAVAEVFTTTFVLIMFAGGAFAAAAAAALGLPLWVQLIAFGAVSAAALWLVRPAIRGRLDNEDAAARMGLAVIEGGIGTVLETVDPDHGLIKIEGETWRARAYDHTQVIEKGERVRVIEIKGATALVWRE